MTYTEEQIKAMQPQGITQLGAISPLPASPEEAVLECSPFYKGDLYRVPFCTRFTIPEFTSLCPVTGQPDFAHFTIDYVPNLEIIESKSLKLFMGSFRNHKAFHESTTVIVGERLANACMPKWLRVAALWYPRGGIPIDVFWQVGTPPTGVYIPPVDHKPFMGR